MNIRLVKNNHEGLEIKAQPEAFLIAFILIWFSGFGGMPLMSLPFVAYEILSNLGTKTLTYQRNNNKVTCQEKQENLLGLTQPVIKEVPQFQEAKFNHVKYSESDPINWLTLITTGGDQEIIIFENEWEQRGFTADAETVRSWSNQINAFLTSNQPELILEYPVSKQLNTLFPLAFMSLFPVIGFVALFSVLQSHSLRFDRINRKIIHCHRTLLGLKVNTYDWRAIQGIDIRKKRGSEGPIYYELDWVTDSSARLPRLTTGNLPALQNLAQLMKELLGVVVNDQSHSFS